MIAAAEMDKQKQSSRIHWLDIAKALLILLVVFHHIPLVYLDILGGENQQLVALNDTSWAYHSWFMPAFFVITGFCSGFTKQLIPFVVSNIKSLLLPAVIFGSIGNWILLIYNQVGDVRSYIHIGGGALWFLFVMFYAKLIYWILCRKIQKDCIMLLAVFLLCIAGIFLNKSGSHYLIGYIFKSFIFIPFVWMGQKIKQVGFNNHKRKFCLLCFSCLFLSILLLNVLDWNVPRATFTIDISLLTFPLFIWLSSIGSLFVLYLSMLINRNIILEYIGRNTIVIYCMHIVFLQIIESFVLHHFSLGSTFNVVIFISLSFSLTIIFCIFFILLVQMINTKLGWIYK